MQFKEKNIELKRFIRATKDAFENNVAVKGESERGYVMTFAVSLVAPQLAQGQPLEGVNASVIKSYLETILKAVSAFSSSEVLSAQLDIADAASFDQLLVEETRKNYEASQKLEGKVPPTLSAVPKAEAASKS